MTPENKNIHSVLIANRGEIASRIIRTCRKMGIQSIAVFSEADWKAPFVAEADLAVAIGSSAPAESYLDQEKILQAARRTGADAIHPGYGFLSENADFARRCAEAGIVFIGPRPEAIEAMGLKSEAKALMKAHDVPVVPGYEGDDQDAATLKRAAIEVGFPVLLKASAGGGGKGMRIVYHADGIEGAIEAAKRESQSAFGNDKLIVEKYVSSGRHIEFQIFGDRHGNALHLLERECSIQRRYQKVIEESPSPALSPELRQQMGAAAVKAACALQYDNAGTVEFLLDTQTGAFYFLEVNTRLQVEHPVTEAITGLDLVQMQIEAAQGKPLSISQAEVHGRGYAIEARLYAEDPANDFLPATGRIERFKAPSIEGLRLDTAVRSGSEISVFYDPMIAKIIVWDQDRAGAHRKMTYTLEKLVCQGVTTNQEFLLALLKNEQFQEGEYNTHFIKDNMEQGLFNQRDQEAVRRAGIAVCLFRWQEREDKRVLLRSLPSGWRNNFYEDQQETYRLEEEDLVIRYRYLREVFQVQIDERDFQVRLINVNDHALEIQINDFRYQYTIARRKNHYFVHDHSGGNIRLTHQERFPIKEAEKAKGGYEAPMPSQVVRVMVKQGDPVEAGQPLIIISSMKMETTIEASEAGTVDEVFAIEGENVEAGFLLLKVT